MKPYHINNERFVTKIFKDVFDKYDIMNDLMSLGIHRVWKRKFINWLNPQKNTKLIDVASGTGDIAKLFSKKNNNSAQITCVEPNDEMCFAGKSNLANFKNIKWHKAKAEKLPFKNDTYDFYTISYGIRNVADINLSLKEALRVLKPGGRFMCLEFSKIDNEIINLVYQKYSKVIPVVGKYIVGSSKPYNYLVKSINEFYTQNELANLIKKNGFSNVEYRNLSNGISAIHSGWKI